MAARLVALCFAASDPLRVAPLLGRCPGRGRRRRLGRGLHGPAGRGHRVPDPVHADPGARRPARTAMHLDLTSTSLEDQQQTVARSLALGARHIDVGQRPEEGHVVLADPEGNEFCVIEPGNAFLADCGFVGALACDGSQEVGYFWSEALGWPLVWDQDQETAIRSPAGGPKVTWGGPPLMAKTGKNRVHVDVAPPVDGDQRSEVDRLVSLGATTVDTGQGEVELGGAGRPRRQRVLRAACGSAPECGAGDASRAAPARRPRRCRGRCRPARTGCPPHPAPWPARAGRGTPRARPSSGRRRRRRVAAAAAPCAPPRPRARRSPPPVRRPSCPAGRRRHAWGRLRTRERGRPSPRARRRSAAGPASAAGAARAPRRRAAGDSAMNWEYVAAARTSAERVARS